MKKLLILITVLNSFAYCFSQQYTAQPTPNYVGDAIKFNIEQERRNRAEQREIQAVRQQQIAENQRIQDIQQAKINEEIAPTAAKYKEGNLSEALIAVNVFIDNNPNNLTGYNYRGIIRYSLNDYIGSIADFNKCIALSSYIDLSVIYCNRGMAKEKLNDFEGAIKDFTSSNGYKPNRDAFYYRGLSKIKLEKNGCSDLKRAEELGHDLAYEMIQKYCK